MRTVKGPTFREAIHRQAFQSALDPGVVVTQTLQELPGIAPWRLVEEVEEHDPPSRSAAGLDPIPERPHPLVRGRLNGEMGDG